MKRPAFTLLNSSSDKQALHLAVFQTSAGGGWEKVTIWHEVKLPKDGSATIDLSEPYFIGLEYEEDGVRVKTDLRELPDGIGGFMIRGVDGLPTLEEVETDRSNGLLELKVGQNFFGEVEVAIYKGKYRVFPLIRMIPGSHVNRVLHGAFNLAIAPQNFTGNDVHPEFLAPVTQVSPGANVTATGSKEEGYTLNVAPGISFPA